MKLAQGILLLGILVSSLSLTSVSDPVFQSSVRIPDMERSESEEMAVIKKVALISPEQALSIVRKLAPSASMSQVELENEDGNVVYEIDIVNEGAERTIIVDAGNGSILADYVDD